MPRNVRQTQRQSNQDLIAADNLEFEATDYDREIWLKDSVKKPYITIDYKLRSINPRKELIVTVDTDDTLLQ